MSPVLSLGWTINYEMFFYAIFAIGVLFSRHIAAWFISIFFIVAVSVNSFIPPQTALHFWSEPIVLLFIFGIWLAIVYDKMGAIQFKQPIIWFLSLITLIVIAHIAIVNQPRTEILYLIDSYILPTLIVAVGVFLPSIHNTGLISKFFSTVGDSSYSLYLCHPFAINLSLVFVLKLHLVTALTGVGMLLLAIFASIIASIVSYYVLEKPVIAFFKRSKLPKATVEVNK